MEKIDIIKLLINNKAINDNNNTDYETQKIGYLLNVFFDEYIEPLLIDLNNKNIEEYNSNQVVKEGRTKLLFLMSINILRELVFGKDNNTLNKDISYAEQVVNLFSLKKYQDIVGNDNLDILQTKDVNLKKEIASKIVEVFIYNYNKKCFYEDNIVPILKVLNQNKRIIYKDNYQNKNNDSYYIGLRIASIIDEMYFSNYVKDEKGNIVNFLKIEDDNYKRQVAFHIVTELFLPFYESEDYNIWLKEVKSMNIEQENFSNLDFTDYSKVIKSVFKIN